MNSPTGNPEPETVLAELGLSRELTLQRAVVSTLGFLLELGVFGGLYGLLTGGSATYLVESSGVGWWNAALDLLVFLALTTAIIVPHELMHGLAIRYYGNEPRYGVGLAHFVFALAPLVVLTPVGVALMVAFEWGWMVVPLAANAGGAVGDCRMVLTLLGYPSHVRVEDGTTGVGIFGRPGDRERSHSVIALVWALSWAPPPRRWSSSSCSIS